MADLKKIQDCIDQIAPLIEEVEALQPVTKGRFGGTPVEPTYLADDINALKEKIDTWHAVTAQILVNEVGDSNPQLFDFSSRWRAPIRAYDYKTSLKRKLERARSDLRILLAVVKEKGEDTPAAAVKPPKVCISPNADEETLNAHLNSLKDDLAAFFGSKPIDQTKWEHERKQFVQRISEIKDADVPGEARDLFDTLYLPHPEPGIIAVRLQDRFLLPFRQCGTGGIHR